MNKSNDGTGIQEKRTKGKLESYLNEIFVKKRKCSKYHCPQATNKTPAPGSERHIFHLHTLDIWGLSGGDFGLHFWMFQNAFFSSTNMGFGNHSSLKQQL